MSSDDRMTLSTTVQDYVRQVNRYQGLNWQLDELERCEGVIDGLIDKYANNLEALNEIAHAIDGLRAFSPAITEKVQNLINNIQKTNTSELQEDTNVVDENLNTPPQEQSASDENLNVPEQDQIAEVASENDNKYIQQMNILTNDFNRKYEETLRNSNLDEMGFIDLRILKQEIETLHSMNQELQNEAAKSISQDPPGISLPELTAVLNAGERLFESNRVRLIEIDNQIHQKVALFVEKKAEIRETRAKKQENEKAIDATLQAYNDLTKLRVPPETKSIIDSQIKNIENVINRLEEIDKGYQSDLDRIEGEIDILRFGGDLPEFEEVQEQTTGLTEEQAKVETEKIEKDIKEEAEKTEEKKEEQTKEPGFNILNDENDDLLSFADELANEDPTEQINLENPIELELNPEEDDTPFFPLDDEPEESELLEPEEVDFGEPDEADISELMPEEPEEQGVAQTQAPKAPNIVINPPKMASGPSVNTNTNTNGYRYQYSYSLEDLKQQGKLPSNLSDEKIIDISKALGIKAADMSYVPNKEEMNRLTHDKDIRLAFANMKISNQHRKETEKFEKVADKYRNMDTSNLDQNFYDRVDTELDAVENRQSQYENIQANRDGLSVSEHFKDNSIAQIRAEKLDKKAEKINEKLRSQYKKLEEQRNEEKNSKIKKQISDYRIKKTLKRIEKLQQKEVKVTGKQFAMMDKATKKFISKREKDIEVFQEKQKTTEAKIEKVNELMEKRDSLEQELSNVKDDLSNSQGMSFGDKIDRFRMQMTEEMLKIQLERMNKKISKCDRKAQVSTTFDFLKATSRKM